MSQKYDKFSFNDREQTRNFMFQLPSTAKLSSKSTLSFTHPPAHKISAILVDFFKTRKKPRRFVDKFIFHLGFVSFNKFDFSSLPLPGFELFYVMNFTYLKTVKLWVASKGSFIKTQV